MKGTDRFLFAGSHLTLSHFTCLLAGKLIFSAAAIADYKTNEAISLAARNQPLSLVLQQLSEIPKAMENSALAVTAAHP